MKKDNKISQTEIEKSTQRFEKANIELQRINAKIQPFKVKSEMVFTTTEGKWFETAATYESRF